MASRLAINNPQNTSIILTILLVQFIIDERKINKVSDSDGKMTVKNVSGPYKSR